MMSVDEHVNEKGKSPKGENVSPSDMCVCVLELVYVCETRTHGMGRGMEESVCVCAVYLSDDSLRRIEVAMKCGVASS